jgi:quercetin dioxygenase-like cupin family protein
MAIKYNEATNNRPDGERVIDSPYVLVDIPAYIKQLKEEKAWKESDRNGITVFKTDRQTIVLTALHEAAVIKENTIDGLVTLQVIEGSISVDINGENIAVYENQVLTIHPKIQHRIKAFSDSVILFTNHL